MTRPYGSWESETPDASAPSGFDDEAGEDDDDDDDGPAKIPGKDGGSVKPPANGGMRDGGTEPGPEPQPQPQPTDPDSPLAPYAGTYLMRMDMFSQLESKVLTTTLRLKNRISNLMLAEVRVEGDHLVSQETLCHQTYEHNCESGCSGGWRTTPDAKLPAFYPNASTARAYRLDGNKLTGEEAVVALGFTDDNVSSDTKVPTDLNDARLWKLEPSDPSRVGIRTRLQTQVSVAKFDCVVSAVQLFASSFDGMVSDGESPLENASFALTTPPMAGTSLAAQGEPASFCNEETLAEQAASTGAQGGDQTVRFHKTDARDTCPAVADFEQALPGRAP